ncbi:hypothetical protein I6A60_01915 [Frankia sp. AgB1.9]|uniref:hypothetical protein n=1 Tax=unclassified Frankia TaxID=2632575 RepID=UPI001933FECC|nr:MULTISPECIES: hypothetical protein [unclassified Frankia]MBL7494470.1 hypothetical protein [Frankia sp. AgW1.1]MBL7546642.1 hypothetical protein [Frankia sp. AgB1.9]MBL7618501.1 hypothetical protein [Frankia sp. AgB1.8]
MSKAGYSAVTGGAVALSAATAKSILGVKGHANFGIDLTHVEVGFDGVSASAVPVLVELCYCTFGANSPGTNSTSVTPPQLYGRAVTVGATAAKTWTTEPTTITVLEERLLTPNGGLVIYDWPLGRTPDSNVSEGFVVRCTAPATVNVRATMEWERC